MNIECTSMYVPIGKNVPRNSKTSPKYLITSSIYLVLFKVMVIKYNIINNVNTILSSMVYNSSREIRLCPSSTTKELHRTVILIMGLKKGTQCQIC